MQRSDVIIVGGGPAGSSAAWALQRAGVECLVLDREAFPRTKLCAGWITPEVMADLEFSEVDYPHRLLAFDRLEISLWSIHVPMRSRQYSIRRFEFDQWLLERSGAPFIRHQVRTIEKADDEYEIDGAYRCRYLIGAGGTRCPVFRSLFRSRQPRPKSLQCVTLELEYACEWRDQRCHLWFFPGGLPGYAWYVPKARGYLNIGVGGMADRLQARGGHIRDYWQDLVARLQQQDLIDQAPVQPDGYSYFLRGSQTPGRSENAFVIGDAAGLATQDMCEGIGPAVRSGLLAARSIIEQRPYTPSSIASCTLASTLPRKLLQSRFVERPLRI